MKRSAVIHVQLSHAQQAIERGEYSEAVQCLCVVCIQFASDLDMYRARTVLPISLFLECGVVFVNTETGLRAELRQHPCTSLSCERLLSAVSECVQQPLRRSMWERLHSCIQALSIHVMTGSRTFVSPRLLLRVLHALKYPLRRFLVHANQRDRACAQMVSLLLREPAAMAQRLVRKHSLQTELIFLRQRAVPARPALFHWPEREDYRNWLLHNPGSRVLVTIHMGNYQGAFRCFASEVEAGRKVLSVQRELQQEFTHLHRVDPRLRHAVLPRAATSASTIVAALRAGHTTLAILADLGDRFGDTETVPFFGFPAQLVRGPALLAILGRAPLVPFVCFECEGRDHIHMAPVISARLQPGESLAQGVLRVTCLLAAQMESWIRIAPTQWRFLPTASMFFAASMQEDPVHAQ